MRHVPQKQWIQSAQLFLLCARMVGAWTGAPLDSRLGSPTPRLSIVNSSFAVTVRNAPCHCQHNQCVPRALLSCTAWHSRHLPRMRALGRPWLYKRSGCERHFCTLPSPSTMHDPPVPVILLSSMPHYLTDKLLTRAMRRITNQ